MNFSKKATRSAPSRAAFRSHAFLTVVLLFIGIKGMPWTAATLTIFVRTIINGSFQSTRLGHAGMLASLRSYNIQLGWPFGLPLRSLHSTSPEGNQTMRPLVTMGTTLPSDFSNRPFPTSMSLGKTCIHETTKNFPEF